MVRVPNKRTTVFLQHSFTSSRVQTNAIFNSATFQQWWYSKKLCYMQKWKKCLWVNVVEYVTVSSWRLQVYFNYPWQEFIVTWNDKQLYCNWEKLSSYFQIILTFYNEIASQALASSAPLLSFVLCLILVTKFWNGYNNWNSSAQVCKQMMS